MMNAAIETKPGRVRAIGAALTKDGAARVLATGGEAELQAVRSMGWRCAV